MTAARPLLSAHRGGPGADPHRENTLAALHEAVTLDCEYVEFDVQRCRGGAHVLYHDDDVLDGGRRLPVSSLTFDEFCRYADTYLLLDEALEVFRDRKKVHLDLKFLSDPEDGGNDGHGHEVELVAHVVEVMGAENVLVTTLEDESVAAVRAWSRDRYPGLLVGLSLGRGVALRRPWLLVRTRLGELFPGRRLRRCDANLVVCHKGLARAGVARWAGRHGLPLLVWTVDRPRELRAWLRDPRVWMVTTNFPRLAVRLRGELSGDGDADAGPDAGGDDDGAPPRSGGGAPSRRRQSLATKPTRRWSA